MCQGLGLLLLWGSSAIPLSAGTEPSKGQANWDRVKQLSPGQEILVVQNNAQSFQGNLQSVSDDNVVIRLAAGEQTVAKDNILRVSSRRASHRRRNLALGAGAGVGGGAAIGAAAGNPRGMFSRGQTAGGGAVFGLLVGAAVGAAIPTGGWHEIYRAR
jgi:hypothetical protein